MMRETGNAPDARVALDRMETYDKKALKELFISQGRTLGLTPGMVKGRRVMLKPNLVSKNPVERAATTHPAMVEAAAEWLAGWGARVTVAESPGGPYNKLLLRDMYQAAGFVPGVLAVGGEMNEDTAQGELHAPHGRECKKFAVIAPFLQADLVVNLCRVKTHGLTTLTCGVKNLFGLIPGTLKVEMHARYPDPKQFGNMLIDLCQAALERVKVYTIADGIVAMEGNGPTGGTPRKMNFVLAGWNPFALDLVAADILGFRGQVDMVEKAAIRKLCPGSIAEIQLMGEDWKRFAVRDFQRPDAHVSKLLCHLPGFLKPRPQMIHSACRGCGRCRSCCPQKAIQISKGKAKIDLRNCIRCFCCQELCPYQAVRVQTSWVFRLVK